MNYKLIFFITIFITFFSCTSLKVTQNEKIITQKIWFDSAEKKPVQLEGILSFSKDKRNFPIAILCHPHPLYGGDMNSAVIRAIEKALLNNGFSVLRFNFRGVGNSEGFFGHGILEEKDLEGAIFYVLHNKFVKPGKIIVIGYSFGAKVAFKVSLKNQNVSQLITIGLWSDYIKEIKFKVKNSELKICFIAGELDNGARDFTHLKEFCNNYDLYCKTILIKNADHFFTRNLNKLSNEIIKFLKEP